MTVSRWYFTCPSQELSPSRANWNLELHLIGSHRQIAHAHEAPTLDRPHLIRSAARDRHAELMPELFSAGVFVHLAELQRTGEGCDYRVGRSKARCHRDSASRARQKTRWKANAEYHGSIDFPGRPPRRGAARHAPRSWQGRMVPGWTRSSSFLYRPVAPHAEQVTVSSPSRAPVFVLDTDVREGMVPRVEDCAFDEDTLLLSSSLRGGQPLAATLYCAVRTFL